MTEGSPKTDTSPRFPDYDVMAKRNTPSWNAKSREVVDARLAVRDEPKFFSTEEWRTVRAICDRIVPQPASRRNKVPTAALLDRTLDQTKSHGYRHANMPPLRQAWRHGLRALDDEARLRFGAPFHELPAGRQDTLLELVQKAEVRSPTWAGMSAKTFFSSHVLHDICTAYYTHPTAWNEIGFGGPAAPRGYVRMEPNRRDHWEAAEAKRGGKQHG